MLPWAYQVKCVAEHTQGSIEGVRAGLYTPDLNPPPMTFDALRDKLAAAVATLEALTEEDMEAFIGQPMRFEFKDRGMDFTAEEFLLSFSQPNFYFHCSTAYNILRMKGVPVGKMDFMGRVRIKRWAERFRANQIVWRGPLLLGRARTSRTSTSKPLSFSRMVNLWSGAADHTARIPPGRSASRALPRPVFE